MNELFFKGIHEGCAVDAAKRTKNGLTIYNARRLSALLERKIVKSGMLRINKRAMPALISKK